MTKTIKISLTLIAAALALALMAVATPKVSAQQVEQRPSANTAPQTNEEESYNYKAQSGDSYSVVARKAVQTYGIENKVNLTPAGIIFAETKLTIEAGSPVLEVGQEVKVSKEAVKKYVEAAQKLSKTQQAAWAAYVPFVEFNTDAVGQ